MEIILFSLPILFGIIAILIFIPMQRARKSAGPFFPSAHSTIRKALAAAELKPSESFYDLGAGAAQALIIAEKEFGARATGFEISLLPYALGRLNLFLHRAKAELKFKNLFEEHLGEADVIFVFLAERVMPQVAEKIKREAKPGARIVTYAFELPNMKPEKIIPIHGAWNVFVYKI